MGGVRVTRDTRVYYNHSVESLVTGQEIPAGEFADYLLAGGAPVEAIEATDAPPVGDLDGDTVPDGAAAEVLTWVGDDPTRAATALTAEQQRERPRTTLITALEKLQPVQDPPTVGS
jgi:hypothetical protein